MINRKEIKAEARSLVRSSQVSAIAVTALLLGIGLVLSLIDTLVSGDTYEMLMAAGLPGIFVNILANLILLILHAGYALYCLAVYRGERAEFLTLFDGFSFVGKVILLYIQQYLYVVLWSMLFVIPGIIASYRYRFAIFNLCENPALSPSEAIRMSKMQTNGFKMELFVLDLSFFGWMFLSSLPYGVLQGLYIAEVPIPLPALAVTLVCSLFSGLVDLWRLPYQTLSDVGYFQTAKKASGVGFGAGGPGGPLPLNEDNDQSNYF